MYIIIVKLVLIICKLNALLCELRILYNHITCMQYMHIVCINRNIYVQVE